MNIEKQRHQHRNKTNNGAILRNQARGKTGAILRNQARGKTGAISQYVYTSTASTAKIGGHFIISLSLSYMLTYILTYL